MGRGDKKSARGKRFMGSYGNSRKRADNKVSVIKSAPKAVVAEVSVEEKKKPAKKKAE
ncbi:MAG: 30S ribosomal protein THX [Opitutaceae bacterium]|nr:30S ribosomal protein THX [Cytophagales bacterium]